MKMKRVYFFVDDVRNIIEEVSKKPFEGEKKVIIIHEGNRLTIQAQNALLKTIEEPPIGVYIIILCKPKFLFFFFFLVLIWFFCIFFFFKKTYY